MTSAPRPDPDSLSPAESLFAAHVARVACGEPADLDALCREHPPHADELRRLDADWKRHLPLADRAGLLSTAQAGDPAPVGPSPEERAAIERLLAELSAQSGFQDRYVFEGEIGQGGMGVVYRVLDQKLDRRLALKVIRGRHGALPGAQLSPPSARQLARFLNEARITSQLDHPGIVPVHEAGADEEGRVYFTMKLVQGRTLAELLELHAVGNERWTLARMLGILQRVCEAVAFAHERGVIHRDLKPSNVMVGDFGEVYVMDWGLARRLGVEEEPAARSMQQAVDDELSRGLTLTREGELVGSPAYMSPEQARGESAAMGPWSDVYALGAILHELLAGRAPYEKVGEQATAAQILARAAAGPAEELVSRTAPPELVAICHKAIAWRREQRYANVRELAADIERFLAGRTVKAMRTGAWIEARKWVQRNRSLASALAAAVLILVAGVIGTSIFAARADEKAREADAARFETLMKNVDSAAQRGDWAGAVEAVHTVRESSFEWPTHLYLVEARALLAAPQPEAAAKVLDELAARPDAGAFAAQVRLLRTDIALELAHAIDRGEVEIPADLEQGLEGADLHYARALLARDTETASRELDAALELDPFHYAASSQRLVLWIFQGRYADALASAEVAHRMRPADAGPLAAKAVALSRLGREAESRACLEQIEREHGAAKAQPLAQSNALFTLFDQSMRSGIAIGDPAADMTAAMRAQTPLLQSHATSFGALGLTIPALRRGWAETVQGMLFTQQEGMAHARELFRSARESHRDAFFTFMEASSWTCSHDNTPAQKMEYFRRAVELFGVALTEKSLVAGIEPQARFLRLRCNSELSRQAKETQRKAQILEDANWFAEHPDFSQYQLTTLVEEPCNQQEPLLGLRVALAWNELHPGTLECQRLIARMAYFSGAWKLARSSAEAVLGKDPAHAEAARVIERSLEAARAWADQETPRPPWK